MHYGMHVWTRRVFEIGPAMIVAQRMPKRGGLAHRALQPNLWSTFKTPFVLTALMLYTL